MTDAPTPIPYLYVLVRTDMKSQGIGKACAQAVHAGNQFTNEFIIEPLLLGNEPHAGALAWSKEAEGFGTTITLTCPSKDALDDAVQIAVNRGYPASEVIDPTYPYIVDAEIMPLIDQKTHTQEPVRLESGDYLCFRREVTCAYIFVEKAAGADILGGFDLLPNTPIIRAR